MAWVAVSEATTAHGKQQSITRITRTITTVAMLSGGAAIAAPPAPNQLPTGGQVAAGVAAIGTNGNTMTVTQSSNRAAINWNTFDIGSQAQVNFVQPSANAVALNRVNSGNPSQIFGQLSSNGQIYLINAAGVYFAPGAQVNVGGIVATTMQMSDAAFMAGSTTFERNGSTGKVINEGTITTSLNGYIAMLAPEVRNSGLLLAQSGTVAMGAGERITLNFGPTSKLDSITVTAADIDTLVENRYAIKAPNGLVILSSRAANQLAASVVNSGTIEAKGVSQQGGRILLEGTTVACTGTLDVSSDTAQAGTIQINGKNVSISGNVVATSPVSSNTQGGSVQVQATQSLNVANANLNVSGNQGGSIQLAAHQIQLTDATLNADGETRGGTVQVAATAVQPSNPFHDPLNIPTLPASLAATGFTSISSRGRRGQGGNATLTGDNITLDGNTNINVSGAFGGGDALVGGDWQGSNGVYQATTTYMGQNVTIDASATDTGDGGKVVLWSDIHNANSLTQVDGTIKATGANGTGGMVETSGHLLGVNATASVQTGQGGEWLLDPADVTISNGGDSSYSNISGTWTPNSGVNLVTINNATLAAALNSGNVTVTAYNSGSQGVYGGSITVANPVSWTGSGNLSLYATGAIDIKANINSTGSGAGFTAKASGSIIQRGNVVISTNRGDVTLWSYANVAGVARDFGYIDLEVRANITTSGGNIILGGGNGTSALDGYATSSTDTTFTNGIRLQGNTLNSDGGNITLRGRSPNVYTGTAGTYTSGTSIANSIIDSGTGKISITGLASGSGYTNVQALGLNSNTFSSANTASDAINLVGVSGSDSPSSISFLAINMINTTVSATGAGGGVMINGTNSGSGWQYEACVQLLDNNILAASGPIVVISNERDPANMLSLYLWGNNVFGTNNATVSMANITLRSDSIRTNGISNFTTNGTLTIESLSDSFVTDLSFPIANITLGSGVSGLTLGKSTNTANITIGSATSIAGPITVYAGNIAINAGLTTTASGGNILLKAANAISTAAGLTLQTNNGSLAFWSNSNGSAAGGISLANNITLNTANGSTTQDSGGGDIVMGGGSNVGSTPTGYATSNASAGVKIGADSNGTTTIRSGGGNVTILGCSSSTTGVAAWGQLDLNSGQGAININGSTSSVSGYGVAIGGANTNIQSAKTSGTAINIKGVSTSMYGVSDSSASTSKYIVATGGGDIIVNGTGGAAGIYSDGIAYLASGGSITLNGSGTNAGIWFQNTISTLGQMSGSAVPSSAANIKLNADVITRDVAPGFFTSGNVTIQSISDSFSSAFSTTNFTFGNSLGRLGGLTIGKATNTQNVTISNDTNISGAIAVYGGNISVNGTLTTSNTTTGDINLYAANGASVGSVTGSNNISLADNRTLTISQNGSSTYSGVISGNGSSLVKGGSGALTLSGANTYNGTTNITAGTLIVSGSLSDSTVVNVSADANYNLSASDTIGSFAGLGTINLGSYNLTTASNSSTVFDGVLAGNGNLSKGGTGSLTLNGTNTYSGITTVSCGTLALASDASLGTAPGSATAGRIVLNGGTLQATANFTLNANRGISLGASNGTFSVDPSITLNYAGIIAGTGSMTKAGSGTLVLSGTNTYSGNTTISAGALIIDGSGSLASGNYAGNISNNGELAFNTSTAQTLSGIISGTGSLTQNGSGTVFLSGNNTYTGNTTISDGTLQLDSGGTINNSVGIINNGNLTYNNSLVNTAALVSGTGNISVGTASSTGTTLQLTSTLGVTGALSVYNGNVLDLNGYSSPNAISIAGTGISSGGALINSNATAALQSGAVTLTADASIGGSGNLTISGNISGAYSLTKIGAGSTTLSGANTYSGNTTISGGTLSVSSDANLGTAPGSATTNSLVLNGGTLEATANFTLDANRGISLGTSNGTFSIDPSVSLNYAGIMAGTGNMTKSGSGTLVLGGANTYNGTTTISAGTLIVNSSGSLGSGSYASNISNSGNLTFNTTTAQALSGIISGAGNLTQNGVGKLTLTGTNTYSGSTTIGSGANLQLGNNGTTGAIDSTSSLVDNGTLTFNRSNAVTYNGEISGTGGLTKAGSGTLSLTAANTYSGSTNVTAGTLQIGAGGTAGSVNGNSAVNISSGTTFVVNRSDNVTLANAISGSGNLSAIGSNVTTLTGAATYSGTTNVTNGGIVFTNNATPSTSGFIGNGTVTIQPNGSAFSSARTLSYTYASTLTGLTVGNATSTSNTDLTVSSAINISGPISLYGGNITLSSGLATNNSANGNVLLKAASNISQTVSVETNGSSVIYWVDSDGNGIGTISVNGTSSSALANITTNGGDIWMGGGSGSTTWNGITVGNASATTTTANTNAINIVNASLIAGAGNISLSGLSNSSTGTGYNYGISVRTNTNISTTSGSINIAGSVSGSYAAGTGVTIGDLNNTSGNTTITTTTGSISLTGTAQNTSNSGYRHALLLYTGANAGLNISTSSGDITLSGTNNSTGSDSSGVQIMSTRAVTNNLNVVSRTGNISIYGIAANASTNQNNNGFRITANNTINNIRIGYDGTNDYSGDILIQSDSILQQNIQPGNGSISVQSTGNLTIQSNGSSFTYLRAGTNGALTFDDDWNFGTSLASFTLGKSTNTLNVSLSNALEVAGPIQLYGGNISLNGTLTTTSSGIIKLKANSGNITQNATGVLTTDGLALLGGNATLTAASNNVTTLAAQNIGSMSFKNAGNLTIGSVNPTGVNATGPVNITVQSGNIDLTEAIITTSNATNAIVLNAGAGSAVGNVSGGNILVSGNGSVSVGTGGRATLYTGSVADSAGVTDLVGSGSGNFRYNSNATTNNFNTTAAPLGDGVYAIYREQPTLTLSTANASIVYGNSTSTAISSTAVNGDTLAQIFGSSSVPTVTVSGNTSTAGYYTAGNHTANISGPNATILGYAAPTYSNGTIEITKASLTVTGTVVANTTYSNSTAATFSNDGSLVGVLTNGSTSDEVTLTAAGNFSSKNVGTNLTVTMTDSISGADAGNYVLTQPTGLTGNITQADLTITANGASTQYGLGTNLTAVGYTTSGLVSGETIGSVDLASNGSANTTNVGSYNITAANATGGTFISSNYNISYVNGTLTITQADLTITANSTTSLYGQGTNLTAVGYTTSGLANGETIGNVDLASSGSASTSGVSSYNITAANASGGTFDANNYNISYANGTLTVNPAPLGIAFSDTYNGSMNFSNVSSGFTLTGLQNGETITSANITLANANVGFSNNYITGLTVVSGNASMSNYLLNNSYNGTAGTTRNTATLTAAPLTITAQAANMTYNGTGYTGGNVSYSGFVGSDSESSMTGSIAYSGNSQGAINAGTYTITASGQTNTNYAINYVDGTLTIEPASLGISANGIYSGSTTVNPTSYTVTGLVNGETLTNITSVTVNDANVSGNGANYVTAIGASNGTANLANYQLTQAYNASPNTTTTNVFTMAKANLTVTADNDAIFVTQSVPGSYNVSYNGFVGGQDASSSGITVGSVTNSASNGSVAGTYTLTPTGFSAANYNVATVNGTFSIIAANKLLVQTTSTNTTYGSAINYADPTVQYLDGNTTIVTLTLANHTGNTFTYADGSSGTVTFTLGAANGTYSTSNNLNVGGYQITGSDFSQTSPNFNGTVTYTGSSAVNAVALTASTSNISKVYDGTTSMNGLNISLTPVVSGDVVTASGAGAFSQANVGSSLGYNVSGLTLGGADASNYYLTGGTSFTGTNGVITPAPLTITANNTSTQYGLGTTLGTTAFTSSGLVNGETLTGVTLASTGAANTSSVGSYNITASSATGANGFATGNYNISYANGSLSVYAANITVTADDQSRTYGGSNPTSGNTTLTTGSLYNGDTLSTATLSSAANATSNVGNYTLTASNQTLSVGLVSNYNISYVAGNLQVTPANLTVTANSTSTQYGLGTNLTAVGYTTSGLVNSETIGSVALSSSGSANTSSVGSYNITAANATGGTFTASNYNINYVNGTLSVTQANLTITANNASSQYGQGTALGTSAFTTSALQNGETVGSVVLASNGSATTSSVGSFNITASGASGGNFTASNYNISYVNGTLTVTQANLTITANNVSTQYGLGTTLGTTAFTSSGLANGETIGSVVLASSGTANTTNVGSYNITASGASGGNFTASNYNISYANGSLTVTPANITVTADDQTRLYGALNPTTGNITVSGTLYNGDTMSSTANVSSTATNTTAAGQTANLTPSAATFTNGLAGNYNIHYTNGTLTVNPAPLGVVATGVYNGTTTLTPTSYALTGLANGETVTSVSVVSLSNANVAANTYITGLTSGGGTANLSNYQISQAYNDSPNTTTTNAFTMAKANLTVTADNAANFIGQGLPGSYNVSYTGFVAGQNASNAGLSAGTVSNSANGSSGAGTYTLTPSGFSASNYSIAYTNGTYTIVPADTLLVQTGSLSTTYGTSATLTPTSVQYYVNGTGVVNLNYVNNSGSTYTYNDGYGGTVTFTLSPSNAAYSTSNNLKAATYQISGSNLTQTGVNLNGSGVYVGSLTINQQALTASTSDVSKVYDGTTAMSGLNVGLSPVVSGDVVTTAGTGAFSQANAGTNLSYNVSGLSLGGADAGNYYLTGGTSFSGSNGVITPRTVTLSADQVYSGSTALTNVTIGNLVGNQTLTYTGNASSKNVADNGSNYIANLLLGNGTDGGLSDNYQLPTLNLTNAPVTITRLNSVTWTGGASGNWFDPANWTGGAVPDLNNVANVILPAGVTVFFNNTVVPPAQAGTVSVDSITGASANLSQSAGNLSVGLGGITLYTLNQSNGTLTSLGPINLTNYIQSGGNLTANSNFTTISFDQNGGATIILGALDTTSYNQSNGTTSVTGNLSTGNMTLTGGTTNALSNLVVTNTLDQQAGNLSVTGNTTAGNINLSGGNLTANGSLTAVNLSQTNGTLTANSSVTVNGTYSLSGGNATVAGNLSANTLSQSGGAITVNGNATTQTYNQSGGSATILGALDATNYTQSNGTTSVTGNLSTGNMTLTGGNTTTLGSLTVNGSYHQTGGQVNVTGNANITTTGTMTLGNLTVGGTLHANSTSGSINQTSGTQMSVTGRASFYAPNGIISLNSGNSFPGGESIIDRNGDRNKPVSSGTDWVFQQIMVQGGTMIYLPLPKTQVGQSRGSHRAMAFTGEVILLADESPENSTDPGYMAQPYAGFTDRNFGTAPIITLLPETEGGKVVQHGDRLFIVNTDSLGSPNVRRAEEDKELPKPGLQLSGPEEVPPVKVEQISRVFP